MLRADQVAEFTDGFGTVPEVTKFPLAVERGGVPDDVIMNMVPVDMCADDECVLAFEKPLGEFVADVVGFLGGDFAGLERLADLIGDDITLLLASGEHLVLAFCQREFCGGGFVVAGVGRDQFAVGGLGAVCGVVSSLGQAAEEGFLLVLVYGDDSCCGDGRHLLGIFIIFPEIEKAERTKC